MLFAYAPPLAWSKPLQFSASGSGGCSLPNSPSYLTISFHSTSTSTLRDISTFAVAGLDAYHLPFLCFFGFGHTDTATPFGSISHSLGLPFFPNLPLFCSLITVEPTTSFDPAFSPSDLVRYSARSLSASRRSP